MRRIQRDLEIRSGLVSLLLCSGVALAQCPTTDATLPSQPLTYPMTSDQYSVQYQIGGGGWTNATVYISYYGETDASPYRTNSGYTVGKTSMSFVSIPAQANAMVRLRVTNWFRHSVSGERSGIRAAQRQADKRHYRQRRYGADLHSHRGQFRRRAVHPVVESRRGRRRRGRVGVLPKSALHTPGGQQREGSWPRLRTLPEISPPSTHWISRAPWRSDRPENVAYPVPANILNIFLGPNAWVQGKLRFAVTGHDDAYLRSRGVGREQVQLPESRLRDRRRRLLPEFRGCERGACNTSSSTGSSSQTKTTPRMTLSITAP